MIKRLGKRLFRALGYTVYRDSSPTDVDPEIGLLVAAMWPVVTDRPLLRAGGDGDGAYLIPDDLEGVGALFSPGVDQVSAFEDAMAARGMRCYLADGSVSGPASGNPSFHFEKKYLGMTEGGEFITLDDWVARNEPGDHDLMLQMDIEGAEWLVLATMSDALLARFRVMVIEFHSLTRMFDEFGGRVIPDILRRLLRTHHVVHSHPNNVAFIARRGEIEIPDLVEMTFLRKDRGQCKGYADQFPHALDIVNVPERPVMPLPRSWYAPA